MSSSRIQAPRPRDPARLIGRYLRSGTRSRAEVGAYLARRGVSSEESARLLSVLQRAGAVDDRACAKLWVQRLVDDGYTWSLIRERLREKQLSERLIDEQLTHARTQHADDGRVRALAKARLSRLPVSDPRRRARLARWLASRGFDSDLIDQVLAELIPVPVSHD